jgi:surface antigen
MAYLKHSPPFILMRILTVLAALWLLLSGCTTKTSPSPTSRVDGETGIAGMPVYIPGTVFVYASGRWDRVESVNGTNVSWVNHRGHPATTTRDFTFRPTSWKTDTHEGTRAFEPADFLFSSKAFSLWPLSVGKVSGYYEVNRWHPVNEPYRTYRAYWSCEVEGEAKVSVPAGDFDTLKIVCSRFSGRASSSPAYAREYRTWYYAEEINHWVAYERDYRGDDRRLSRKRLASVIPSKNRPEIPETDRGNIARFYQNSLSSSEDGATSVWQSDLTSLQVRVTPVQTFMRNSKTTCRQYRQLYVIDDKEEKYFGIACRQGQDEWEVPMR